MDGALLVDKPCGPTSHDVVAFARRALGTRRIGHTGTLDPLATGLLVLLVGHATRLAQFLAGDEKEYVADVRLGAATPTYDAQSVGESFRLKAEATGQPEGTGEAEATSAAEGSEAEATSESEASAAEATSEPNRSNEGGFRLQAEDLQQALTRFVGTYQQRPPPFSAKKVGGVRAYEKARRHEPVELEPVEVTVRELDLLTAGSPTSAFAVPCLVRLRIVCSAGFYVRSLAHDLGAALGCGGHLEALRRTRAGRFRVDDAVTLDALEATGPGRMISVNDLLGEMPEVRLTAEGLRRAGNGNTLAPGHLASPSGHFRSGDRARVLDASGEVLTVAEYRADGLLHPLLVLR